MNMPFPCLVIATVAAAGIPRRDADQDVVTVVVRGIEAARAENAGVIVGACLAPICSFAVLEDVAAWLSLCSSRVFGAFYRSLRVSQAPRLLLVAGQPCGKEEREMGIVSGEGAKEDSA
jgi:hypothetical protein